MTGTSALTPFQPARKYVGNALAAEVKVRREEGYCYVNSCLYLSLEAGYDSSCGMLIEGVES